jgi:peptidyl-prolyl cis-trans isomerase SurA
MLALTACGAGDDSSPKADPSEEPTSQEESAQEEAAAAEQAPAVDLEGIPDVVAEVNGQEVMKDDFVVLYEAQFQQAAMQAQMSGEQPDEDALKQQTADQLVDTTLLTQEAEARGIDVTEQDVDAELAAVAKENQLGSVEELFAALEKQGATEDQARTQLESQMVIEQLLADEAGPIEPTEQDLRGIYQRAKEQQAQSGQQGAQTQKIPPYAQVKPQLEEQAKADRMAEVGQMLVDALREDADITINL